MVNDREYGGVFYSHDAGQHWLQKAAGLGGQDVFALKQAASGMIVAGTNHGIFGLDRNASEWRPHELVVIEQAVKAAAQGIAKGSHDHQSPEVGAESRVNDLELGSQHWLAATTQGIYSSTDQGKTWKGGAILGQQDFVSVRAEGSLVVAATRSSVLVSHDKGATWKQTALPSYVVSIRGAAIASDSEIMIASREGALPQRRRRARPGSMSSTVSLPRTSLPSASIPPTSAMLATSDSTGVIFESRDGGRSWQRGPDSGYPAAPGQRHRRTLRRRNSV